jgi:hypothetical protein
MTQLAEPSALALHAKFDILIPAVRNADNAHFRFLPPADKVIRAAEIVMVLGRELDPVWFAS